jgi:DNA polymerase
MNKNQLFSLITAYAKNEWCNIPKDASVSENSLKLDALYNECFHCTKCSLYKNATNLVFGTGNPDAKIVFAGEAPGEEEDKQGLPFVGRAGQLLTRALEEAGSSREDVYICNVLKHRPPNNRNPNPDEIALCSSWLKAQLDIIKPRLIITLGNFSTKLLLDTTTGITRLRGKLHPSSLGYDIFPILHPAAILRNMNQFPEFLDDIKTAVKISLSANKNSGDDI